MSVLLPAPFSPIRAWISPGISRREAPETAATPPKDFQTSDSAKLGRAASTESLAMPSAALAAGDAGDRLA